MTITLEQLYEMQKQLDARIIKEKGIEGQDLLPNTVLALQVEIAELAAEWRGFKFWSKNREPRTVATRQGKTNSGSPARHIETYNPLLEEFVDCLHFFLSIARQLDLPADDLYVYQEELEGDTSVLFTELLHNVGMIIGHTFLFEPPTLDVKARRHFFRAALGLLYDIGEQRLGFTFEQITAAYVEKNRINHERQANGY